MSYKLLAKIFPILRHSPEDQAVVRGAMKRLKMMGSLLKTAQVLRSIPGCTVIITHEDHKTVCAVHKRTDHRQETGEHLADIYLNGYGEAKIKWQ